MPSEYEQLERSLSATIDVYPSGPTRKEWSRHKCKDYLVDDNDERDCCEVFIEHNRKPRR